MSDEDVLSDWDPGDPVSPDVVDAWRSQQRERLEQKIERLREELAEAQEELASMEHDEEAHLARDDEEPLEEEEQEEQGQSGP